MHHHHRQTLENLRKRYASNLDYTAFIVIGSVGWDEARPESDVDYYLVVEDQLFADLAAKKAVSVQANECRVASCPEVTGSAISRATLRELRDRGSELRRWAFLATPNLDTGQQIIGQLENYKAYPVLPEGLKARIAEESILNLEEW